MSQLRIPSCVPLTLPTDPYYYAATANNHCFHFRAALGKSFYNMNVGMLFHLDQNDRKANDVLVDYECEPHLICHPLFRRESEIGMKSLH